ncbi:GNAT family N-acetyltransferase [Candidatus Woesearchaeota archaeon]|nr:GNAT family N-acetyltransferase [Candidatus Woesearchaeota archaeon]
MIDVFVVDEKNEHEYADFLEQNKESVCQQTIEWRDVIMDVSPDKPIFLLAKRGGKVVGAMPNYIFKCELGNIMTSIPHAGPYGGIVSEKEGRTEIYKAIFKKLLEIAEAEDCVLSTIVTPPFFSDIELYRETFKPDFVMENFFQYIDIGQLNLRRDVRRRIKEAEGNNLVVSDECSAEKITEWYAIHKKRMMEIDAQPIPENIFINASRSKKAKFFFIYLNKRMIAGALFIFHNTVVDIYMMSADSEHFSLRPNFLLVNHALKWAKDRGFRHFNWESSPSRESGTYAFKEGWGSIEKSHHFLTKILGNTDSIRNTELKEIKNKYRWHFVLPYSCWGEELKK